MITPSTQDLVSLKGLPCFCKRMFGKNEARRGERAVSSRQPPTWDKSSWQHNTAQFDTRFPRWPAALHGPNLAFFTQPKLPVSWKTATRWILSVPQRKEFHNYTTFLDIYFYLHCFKDIWVSCLLQESGKCLQLQKKTPQKTNQPTKKDLSKQKNLHTQAALPIFWRTSISLDF